MLSRFFGEDRLAALLLTKAVLRLLCAWHWGAVAFDLKYWLAELVRTIHD